MLAGVSALLEPLQYAFMQRSLLAAVLIGILCATVGSYLIVQRLALLGDAISHSVLPGLAIAYMIGVDIIVGALVAGVVSTALMNWIKTRSPIKEDAAMGIVFSAFFALGITLITLIQKDQKIDLNHFLFGNILSISNQEVVHTALIAIVVIAVIRLLYKELMFYTFDPIGAEAVGLPTNLLNFGLTLLIALTIVASLKSVGVILVLAMLIIPGATAYLWVTRLHQMMIVGSVIGVFASVVGMYLSYFYNLPSGAAIVLVAFGLFLLAFLLSPTHGVLTHPRPQGWNQPKILQEIRRLGR